MFLKCGVTKRKISCTMSWIYENLCVIKTSHQIYLICWKNIRKGVIKTNLSFLFC